MNPKSLSDDFKGCDAKPYHLVILDSHKLLLNAIASLESFDSKTSNDIVAVSKQNSAAPHQPCLVEVLHTHAGELNDCAERIFRVVTSLETKFGI